MRPSGDIRCFRIPHRNLDLAIGIGRWVEDRHVISAVFGGSVNLAFCIYRRIPPIGCDFVVQIGRGITPFPLGDHDIARNSGRTFGRSERKFTGCNAVGPLAEQFERLFHAQVSNVSQHECRCTAGFQPCRPCICRRSERPKTLADRPCAGRAQSVTGLASPTLYGVQPLTLALDLIDRECVFRGHA